MSILSEDELRQALTRAEMAESVELPIEEYRDLVYQALSAIAAESELEAVRKRTIEAEKDAERYRWLREHMYGKDAAVVENQIDEAIRSLLPDSEKEKSG